MKDNIRVGGLIIQSAYLSILDIIKQFGFLGSVGSIFISNRWNNKSLISEITCPILMLHGISDNLIPCTHSQELYEICPSEKKELMLIKGDHNSFDIEEDILGNVKRFLLKTVQDINVIRLEFKTEYFTVTEQFLEQGLTSQQSNMKRIENNLKTFNSFSSLLKPFSKDKDKQ